MAPRTSRHSSSTTTSSSSFVVVIVEWGRFVASWLGILVTMDDSDRSHVELQPLQPPLLFRDDDNDGRSGASAGSAVTYQTTTCSSNSLPGSATTTRTANIEGYGPVSWTEDLEDSEEAETTTTTKDDKTASLRSGGSDSEASTMWSNTSNDSQSNSTPRRAAKRPLSSPPSVTWYNNDYFFPPNVPLELQLLRLDNLALPACYVLVGTLQGLYKPLLNVYPLELGATEAQQTTVSIIATLPCAFKIIFGFVSDNCPILGLRRKPYLAGGWIFASFGLWYLLMRTTLTLPSDDEVVIPPTLSSSAEKDGPSSLPLPSPPSIPLLSLSFFLFGIGLWCADVMADAVVAEKSRLEPENHRGMLQATCYTCRFLAQFISASLMTGLYGQWWCGPKQVIAALAVGPLIILPLVYRLKELPHNPPPLPDQCYEIWNTIQSRAVWQPLSFVFVFNALQVPNAAWRQFLKTIWHFTAAQLNGLLVASYALLYVGIASYKSCCLNASWRRTYQVCIAFNAIASSLQLLLVRGYTLGLGPFLFALGDEALQEFLVGIQLLPCSILMVTLCPSGSEGASYAMFTTVWNNALMLAPALSTGLLQIWNVSKEAFEERDVEGLFRLTILTTLVQVSPIVLVGLLPHSRRELLDLNNRPHSSRSAWGGTLFLVVLAGSMLYTLAATLLNILKPGWAGES